MLVQRVVMPVTGVESWTVLGDDGAVVAPVERYLAYLGALERSPNTPLWVARVGSVLYANGVQNGEFCALVQAKLTGLAPLPSHFVMVLASGAWKRGTVLM